METQDRNHDSDKSHADVLCERLITKTIDGVLDWQPFYGEVRVGPGQDSLQSATQPKGFILTDQDSPFGLTTVKVHDEIAEVRSFNPQLFNNGEQQNATDANLQTLVQAIEVYLEEVQRGERESPQDRASRQMQQLKQQYQHQVDTLQTRIQQKESRIEKLISTISDLGQYANPKPQPPKLTVEELKQITWELFSEARPEVTKEDFNMWFDEERATTLLYHNYHN